MELSKNEIKRVKSLSVKKFRDEAGLFAVEGEKLVAEALASSFDVVDVYRTEEIGLEAMSRISALSSPSPALAVVRMKKGLRLDDAASAGIVRENGLYLGLDVIRDPGNLGTIIRISEWFGVKSVLAAHGTVDLYNPKVLQATMGAVFRVDFHYVNLLEAASSIRSLGGKVYGTFLNGDNIYSRELSNGADSPVMVVTGNESEGISDALGRIVTDRLHIPPFPPDDPGSESLNAAVATAVTLAEFRRRLS
ncbi:MAG: RNA methyltransferase [Bacteroidales bacterium]|nr:RNA methyltransferase [Bacteroidales bacterium]